MLTNLEEHPMRIPPAVRRGLLIALTLVIWLAVASVGGARQGQLSQVQKNDAAAFLPASAESTRADELATRFEDTSTLPALVVITRDDDAKLEPADLAATRSLAEAIPSLTLPGGKTVKDELTGPVVAIPSEDGKAALVPVPLTADRADDLIDPAENQSVLDAVVTATRDRAATVPDGLTAQVTGPAGFVADLGSAFGGIDVLLLLVALGVVFVILVIVYRSPVLPFVVLISAVFALCLAALVVYPLAESGTLDLSGQSQGILSILVIGAATDYGLLLVARHREELTRHDSPFAAMRTAWRASLEPIAASAGTVIVGLLCLLLSDLSSNSSLGPVAAIGIASAFVASLTLLPALLLVLGSRSRALFWPRMPRPADVRDESGHRVAAGAHEEHDPTRRGIWGRTSSMVVRHPRRTWILTAVALLVAAAFVPTFKAGGTSDTDIFLNTTESVTGSEVLGEHFPAGSVEPARVITTPARLEAVTWAVTAVDGVASATPVSDAPQGASGPPPGATGGAPAQGGAPAPGGTPSTAGTPAQGGAPAQGEPKVIDGRVLLEVTTDASAESTAGQRQVEAVRAAAHRADPDALVGGKAAQRIDTQDVASRDLTTIIPVVLVVIFVMLALLLRSLVAPAILLLANILSFAATMGLAALIFNHVLDLPGADATVPLFGFVFLVALGIDYSIFLMTRVREESLRHGTREGVRIGLAVTGGVITSAGLVLAATFATLGVIPLLFLLQLAVIVALGVLVDTFVVRTLLVPGLVHDIGRPTWCPWTRSVPAD